MRKIATEKGVVASLPTELRKNCDRPGGFRPRHSRATRRRPTPGRREQQQPRPGRTGIPPPAAGRPERRSFLGAVCHVSQARNRKPQSPTSGLRGGSMQYPSIAISAEPLSSARSNRRRRPRGAGNSRRQRHGKLGATSRPDNLDSIAQSDTGQGGRVRHRRGQKTAAAAGAAGTSRPLVATVPRLPAGAAAAACRRAARAKKREGRSASGTVVF
jgi:hypothetical protein